MLDFRTDRLEIARRTSQDNPLETAADTSAQHIVHIIRIAGIRGPNIRIGAICCPCRGLHHSRNRIGHVPHQHLFPYRVFRSEKLAGQRIRNDHARQTGTEIGIRKRFAGSEAEIKDLPEAGIGVLYYILLERLAIRQRNNRLVARYRRHRFGRLKRI